MREGEKVD